jgi:SAGA-associated factor 29
LSLYRCGNIPPDDKYVCKPGDKVAALVKSSDSVNNTLNLNNTKTISPDDEDDEENWILAEVVAFQPLSGKYEVDDIDAEEGQERYTLHQRCVVPLPLWRANPLTDPDAIFPKDSLVLALYPQTTCFYRGVVSEAPTTPQEDYLILFEDNTYAEGYSPPLNVPQLYVVAFE